MSRHGLGGAAVVAVWLAGALACTRPQAAGEGEHEAETVVSVEVAPVVRTTLHEYVDAWGTVEPEPAAPGRGPASARVAAPVPGLLSRVRCAEGQRVRAGDVLFELDSRVADVALEKARQTVRFAEAGMERQKALGAGEATSQRQYQEAEQALASARSELAAAQALRGLLDVRAPLAGTVVKVSARPGDAVDPAAALAEIIDLGRLVVSLEVRSSEIARVRLGQPALLVPRAVAGAVAGAAPAAETRGTVTFVGQAVDSRTDTVPVRVAPQRDAGLRPGQFLDVRVVTGERRDRLAVPVEGLVSEDGQSSVAVVEGERAVRRPVKAGLRDGGLVEVEGEGLREGARVVAAGAYGLPKESRIRVIGR